MRLLDYLFGLVALAGLAGTGWWAVYQSPNSAVNLQARLEANANAALDAAGFDWAHVEMDGQTARLKGRAPSADAIQAAALTVVTSSGAGGVLWGGVTQVESAVDAAPPVSPYVWRAIKREDGGFVLLGHVPSRTIRVGLLEKAAGLAGEAAVEDRMQLASGAPGANWQGMAHLALEALSELETGEVRFQDTRLRLRGVSLDDAVRARISADISNVVAPYRGEPFLRGVSQWTATHGDRGLILSGTLGSEAERQEILDLASRHYDGEVLDRMDVASGTPAVWLDGVRAGLPHFAGFRSGVMAFDPDGTGLSFEGEATGSTLLYLQQDLAGLDGRHPVVLFTDVAPVDVEEIDGIDFSGDAVAACQAALDAVLDTNAVQFDPGTATITRESGRTLDKLMAVAARCDRRLVFEVAGHADDAGNRETNLALGEARAQSVRNYMVSAGIDPARLAAIGYGPGAPAQSNETEQGRAKNRRIGIKVEERSE